MKTNNHPAHGPLSNDRLHQIRETLSKAAAQGDGGNVGYAMSDAVKAFDELLEVRKAEPVGEFYHEKQGGWYQISEGDKVPDNRRIPLYTAPPAPVSVPEDFLCMLTGRAKYLRGKGEVKSPELLERAAAMLNGGKS